MDFFSLPCGIQGGDDTKIKVACNAQLLCVPRTVGDRLDGTSGAHSGPGVLPAPWLSSAQAFTTSQTLWVGVDNGVSQHKLCLCCRATNLTLGLI